MVLRGSGVHPDTSIVVVGDELKKARDLLESAEAQLERQRKSLPGALKEAETEYISKAEFVDSIRILTARLELLESQRNQAKREVLVLNEAMTKIFKQLACGGAAGAVSRTIVAPIDRVKILLQTQNVLHAAAENTGKEKVEYRGVVGTLRTVIQKEGLIKLWRGNGANCLRILPYASLQFGSYEFYKDRLLSRSSQKFGVFEKFQAGAMAGVTAASLTYPLDLMRIRLVTNTDPALAGMYPQLKNILAEGGPRALYKGFLPTLTSLSPFIAVNFATMDTLKSNFLPEDINSELVRSMYILSFGATSAIVAQSICYPLDTVRRRMQMKGVTYKGMLDAYKTIIAKEGVTGLYKGIAPNTIKIVPNNGIRWLCYTYFCRFMGVEKRKK